MAPKTPSAGEATGAGSLLERLPLPAKIGITVVMLILVWVLYFVVFFAEVKSQLTAQDEMAGRLGTELTSANAAQAAYQVDVDERARKQSLSREQKKVLPDDAETPGFLSSIQAAATVSGVTLQAWEPLPEQPQDFFAKVPMKLTLAGKFHNVVRFFHGVGQLSRITNVENIQLHDPKVDGTDVTIQVECLATAFRAPRADDASKRKGRAK